MDIEKSLELCSKATPGPWWRTDPPWGDGTSVHAGPSDDPHTATKIVCEFDPFDVQFSPRYDGVDSGDIVEFDHVTDDMAFIADAREGYPEALRIIKRLRELLDHDSLMLPDSTCVEVRRLLSLDGKDGA